MRRYSMSKEEDNKAIVGRWFTEFWGKNVNLNVIDEIAAPDMLLRYSLHEPRRGRSDIRAFMKDFRTAFPDLNFWGTADLIARAIMSSVSGKAAAPTRGRLSRIS
jgi:SnoaL-like polyketide cyclase